MRSILDWLFRYTSSHQTDLRKTFARVRNEAGGGSRSSPRSGTPFERVVILPVQGKRAARS